MIQPHIHSPASVMAANRRSTKCLKKTAFRQYSHNMQSDIRCIHKLMKSDCIPNGRKDLKAGLWNGTR